MTGFAQQPPAGAPIPGRDAFSGVLDAVRSNQPWAWESLHRQLAPELLGWLAIEQPQDAHDVVGDVFAALARDIARFDGDGAALRGWAFRLARARVDTIRRARAAGTTGILGTSPSQSPRVEPGSQRLAAALQALPSSQREMVYLRLVLDMPVRQVAASFELPVRVVEGELATAMASLRARSAELLQLPA